MSEPIQSAPTHEHDWRPYTDSAQFEICTVPGCGMERRRDVHPDPSCDWCAGNGEVLVVPVQWGTPLPASGRRSKCLCVLLKTGEFE